MSPAKTSADALANAPLSYEELKKGDEIWLVKLPADVR